VAVLPNLSAARDRPPLGPGPVGKVIDPVVVQAHRGRPPVTGGQRTSRRSGPALGERSLGRRHVPQPVIQIADRDMQAGADGGGGPADDPGHNASGDSEPVRQRGRRMPDGDQCLQPPPGTGGVPSRGHLFGHRWGDPSNRCAASALTWANGCRPILPRSPGRRFPCSNRWTVIGLTPAAAAIAS
jgi:hypothetical protein